MPSGLAEALIFHGGGEAQVRAGVGVFHIEYFEGVYV
jgi:hypothetical protein